LSFFVETSCTGGETHLTSLTHSTNVYIMQHSHTKSAQQIHYSGTAGCSLYKEGYNRRALQLNGTWTLLQRFGLPINRRFMGFAGLAGFQPEENSRLIRYKPARVWTKSHSPLIVSPRTTRPSSSGRSTRSRSSSSRSLRSSTPVQRLTQPYKICPSTRRGMASAAGVARYSTCGVAGSCSSMEYLSWASYFGTYHTQNSSF
jgi:hypothetical protein